MVTMKVKRVISACKIRPYAFTKDDMNWSAVRRASPSASSTTAIELAFTDCTAVNVARTTSAIRKYGRRWSKKAATAISFAAFKIAGAVPPILAA